MTPAATPKKLIRRPRKTPDQRGEVGWWSYNTMDTLGLTIEAVADRTGVGREAVSKFQGSPKGELGAESRARMLAFYREVAAEKQIPIDEPPVGFIVAGGTDDTTVSPATYLARIDSLIGSVSDLVGELREARRARDAALEELQSKVRALEAWRSNPDPSGSGASAGQPVRPGTGE